MGGFRGKALLFAALCACAPAFAPDDDAVPRPTSRSQLSPLARQLDDALFGDPTRIHRDAALPFSNGFYQLDGERWAQAMKEVEAFRGKQLQDLQAAGQKRYDEYKGEVLRKTRDLMVQRGVSTYRSERVAASWDLLRARVEAGEKPLASEEVDRRALERTKVRVPEAFAPGELGLNDPSADFEYGRLRVRIEYSETERERSKLSQADFDQWKLAQLEFLAQERQRNLLLQLELVLKAHPELVQRRLPAAELAALRKTNPYASEYASVPWAELEKWTLAEPFHVEKVEGRRQFVLEKGIVFRPARPELVLMDYGDPKKLSTVASFRDTSRFKGTIEVSEHANGHLTAVMARANGDLDKSFEALSRFTYADYVRDGGRKFWKEWDERAAKSRKTGLARWRDPAVGGRTLENAPPGFEFALWGRVAADPEHYAKAKKFWARGPGILSELFYGSRYRRQWAELSTEPPTPLRARIAGTAAIAGDRVRRHGPAVVAAALLIGLGGHWGLNQLPKAPASNSASPVDEGMMPPDLASNHLAFNKPLDGISGTPFYEISANEKLAPTRFALGHVGDAKEVVKVPNAWPANKQSYTVKGSRPVRGATALPTADGSELATLQLRTADDEQRVLRSNEYDVRRTPLGEYVIVPKSNVPYTIETAGFAWTKQGRKAPQDPGLQALDKNELVPLAKELEANGFRYLPALLRKVHETLEASKAELSVYDMETILEQSALYSQHKEAPVWFQDFKSEWALAARFLNPDGISCYQCDGARDLGVAVYKRLKKKNSDVQFLPRTVLTRQPGEKLLTAKGLHADILATSKDFSERIPLDTTPGKEDPRTPLKKDATHADSLPPAPIEALALGSSPLPAPGELPPPPLTKEAPAPVKIPWREALSDLFAIWQEADSNRRAVAEPPALHAPPAAGPAGGGKGQRSSSPVSGSPQVDTDVDEIPHSEATTLVVEEVTVPDAPQAKELEARWDALSTLVKDLKAKYTADTRVPPTVFRNVSKLVAGYVRRERTFEELKQELHSYLPYGHQWGTESDAKELQKALRVIALRQRKIMETLRKDWREQRKGPAFDLVRAHPELVSIDLRKLVDAQFQWLGDAEFVQAPVPLFRPEPARDVACAARAGAFGR